MTAEQSKHRHSVNIWNSSNGDSISYKYGGNSKYAMTLCLNYVSGGTPRSGFDTYKDGGTILNDAQPGITISGDTETRPDNYTIRVWKRTQ